MKHLTRFSVLALTVLAAACTTTPATPSAPDGSMKFQGDVSARDNGCYVDGTCTLTVGNTVVTTMSGMRMGNPVWGKVEGDPQVGKRVEVYCKGEGRNCTLLGSESYYVRVLP